MTLLVWQFDAGSSLVGLRLALI